MESDTHLLKVRNKYNKSTASLIHIFSSGRFSQSERTLPYTEINACNNPTVFYCKSNILEQLTDLTSNCLFSVEKSYDGSGTAPAVLSYDCTFTDISPNITYATLPFLFSHYIINSYSLKIKIPCSIHNN